MVFNMKAIRESAVIGFWVGAVSLLISWLLNLLNAPAVNLTFSAIDINVREQLVQGIDTTIGGKLIGFVNGFIPLSLQGIITLFVTAFLIVFVGRIVFNLITIARPRTEVWRFALIMLYGTVVLSLFVSGMVSLSLGFLGVLIAMLIYYAIVSAIVLWLSKADFSKKFVKIPTTIGR